jgi:hypothetical protein
MSFLSTATSSAPLKSGRVIRTIQPCSTFPPSLWS